MKISKLLLISSAIIMVHSTPAFADAKDDKIAAMEAQMKIMMQEIESMKAERAAEKAAQATQNQKLEQQVQAIETKTEAAVANIAPAAGGFNTSDVKVTMKGPVPKIEKDGFSWQPIGRIHLDAASINDDAVDHPNGAEFRRARIGMKGKIAHDFGYKAELDFANENAAIKDMYMNYTGVEGTEIRVGHFKPGYSLNELTSSNDITFIERSAGIDAFSLSHQLGASLTNHGDNYHVTAGVFNDDAGRESSDDEQLSFSGRAVVAPYKQDDKVIHLGASASYREPDQSNDRFDFDGRAENRLQSSDSVSVVLNDADNAMVYGLEAAAASGPLSFEAEYIMADVENTGGQDPSYAGGHAQIAWTVTGESRGYKMSKATFGGIKPNRPLDPSKGDWGALELAARYSHLDLNDGGLNGGEMNNYTIGANWYLNDYMRLMANYIIVDTDNNAVTADDDPEILLVRSQVKF